MPKNNPYLESRRLDVWVSLTFLLVSKGLKVNSKSRKRLLQVTAGRTKFAIMAAPPEDVEVAQIPAAQAASALQDVIPAQAQAPVEPVEVN